MLVDENQTYNQSFILPTFFWTNKSSQKGHVGLFDFFIKIYHEYFIVKSPVF